MDNKLETFCKNYEVKVVNDTQRYARYRPPVFFTDSLRADIVRNDMSEMQTETLYTLQIPESRLKTLMEMESRFHNNHMDRGRRDMFEVLMEKEREEAFYRHTNEAVKKAYEQYSMLLHLAGYVKKL